MLEKHINFPSEEKELEDKINSKEQKILREKIKNEVKEKKDGAEINVDLLEDEDLEMYKKYQKETITPSEFDRYTADVKEKYEKAIRKYKSECPEKKLIENRFNFRAFLANKLTPIILSEGKKRKRKKGRIS